MRYVRKHKEVDAIKLNEPVYSRDGKELAPAGYWLVTEGKEQYYMSGESFLEEFEIKLDDSPFPWVPLPPPNPCSPPYIFGDGWTSDKIEIKSNMDVDYFSGDLPPGKFIFVKDTTVGANNIDELCKNMHVFTSNLDASDLKVSFQVV